MKWIQCEKIDFFTVTKLNVKLNISNDEGGLVEIAAHPDGKNPHLSSFPCTINHVLNPKQSPALEQGCRSCTELLPVPAELGWQQEGALPAGKLLQQPGTILLQHCPGPLSHFHGFLSQGWEPGRGRSCFTCVWPLWMQSTIVFFQPCHSEGDFAGPLSSFTPSEGFSLAGRAQNGSECQKMAQNAILAPSMAFTLLGITSKKAQLTGNF